MPYRIAISGRLGHQEGTPPRTRLLEARFRAWHAAEVQAGQGDDAFCAGVAACTEWHCQHPDRTPARGSSDTGEAMVAEWAAELERRVLAAGGRAGFAAGHLQRAVLLDVAGWWEWPDEDAIFRFFFRACDRWYVGTTDALPSNPLLARWISAVRRAVADAGGMAAYAAAHPQRAAQLRTASWWTANVEFRRIVEDYGAHVRAHDGAHPELFSLRLADARLALWRLNLDLSVRREGGSAAYAVKYPQRASSLGDSSWWGAEEAADPQTAPGTPQFEDDVFALHCAWYRLWVHEFGAPLVSSTDPEEAHLARWALGVYHSVAKRGSRARFAARYPARAALLDRFSWWDWPVPRPWGSSDDRKVLRKIRGLYGWILMDLAGR